MKNNTIDDAQADKIVASARKFCPVHTTMDILAGKWKLSLLWQLHKGTRRFGELKRAIPGITQAVLSLQLQELVADGIVSKHEYAEVPPRTEYSLTDLGRTLIPVIIAMEQWGIQYLLDHRKAEHGDCLWAERAAAHA